MFDVLAAVRTPFGKFGGALRDMRLPELGAAAVSGALERAEVSTSDVDELVLGVNFPGSDRSVARQVSLRAGLPESVPSFTVDRACCSSLAAITAAGRGLRLGETGIAVAGGADNLSLVPYFIHAARFGNRLGDIVLTDQLVVACPHTGVPRAVQAGAEAAEFGVSRREQDEWALRSQQRYAEALAHGWPAQEMVPLPGLDHDEPPRPATSLEQLAALPTVYGSVSVTAGNAPNLSTGASALVLARQGLRPSVATILGTAQVSGDPQRLASMPAHAARKALGTAGLDLSGIDLIEVNEAFAAVPLVTTLVLADGDHGLAEKLRGRTNVNGGAIAIGHPTGATAGRLVATMIQALRRRGGGRGLVTICGGVGEAEAAVVSVG